jgi:ubiquinone/menaquinone biosynthesis C-methylase UbiE
MPGTAPSALGASYDTVGAYDQDAINGFSEQILDAMIALSQPASARHILDAMAGNGNLTVRFYDYCQRRGITLPPVTVVELSHVQCAFARQQLQDTPAQVVWGNMVTLEDYGQSTYLPSQAFDRVILKSGTHEIPLEQQSTLYASIFHVLAPGGLFVNLGFVFDDEAERDQFREITRVKDRLAGMQSAAEQRHFLTREEFYTRLHEAGFVDVRCGRYVQYTINTQVAIQQYFPPETWDHINAEIQSQQARALLLRRRGRIHFQGDSSIMLCPGEITLARRPA